MKKILVVPLLLIMAMLISCSDQGITDPSLQTIRYSAGIGSGEKFKECMKPGVKLNSDDKFYRYPTTQRENVWDSDHYQKNGSSADHPDMEIQVAGVTLFLKVKVQFYLNTDCKPVKVNGHEYEGGTLQAFHEVIGRTRHAYFDKDGSYGGEDSGWIWAMNNYISGPAIKLMNTAVRSKAPEETWLNTGTWTEIAEGVKGQLQAAVDAEMETDLTFYRNFSVNIFSVDVDPEFKKLYTDRKSAQIQADTAEKNKAAKIAEAQADTAVAQEQAKKLKAEIEGYGGPQWYACLKSIEKGMACFQPNGVLLPGVAK